MHIMISSVLVAVLATVAVAQETESPKDADAELSRQVARLVGQLNDDRGVRRDAAEQQLLELAGNTPAEADRFLALLPEINDGMPLAVRERLARIRQKIEERVAKITVAATTVTLDSSAEPASLVLVAIERQTGNRLKDDRANAPPVEGAANPTVTVKFENEPFWSALDQILDQANFGVYNYGGDDALAIVPRDPDDGPRHGGADYAGPFRLEVLEIQAQRNSRQPKRKSLKLQLEVAWEPRLKPIAISQPASEVHATTDAGTELPLAQPDAVLDVEVPTGTQAAEIVLPFDLPPRSVNRIGSLTGKLKALVPGRQAKFRFRDLKNAAGKTQRIGGVQVTVDSVQQNNAIWEVHMRMKLDEDNRALESHRGWVFQNVSYMEDKDGKSIDNAGFETTRQTPNEVGIAYLFDLPDGIDDVTWVYESPAAIVELPIEYELKNIELP